jgi:hypothetical protein
MLTVISFKEVKSLTQNPDISQNLKRKIFQKLNIITLTLKKL